jgi:hypothetical protein
VIRKAGAASAVGRKLEVGGWIALCQFLRHVALVLSQYGV